MRKYRIPLGWSKALPEVSQAMTDILVQMAEETGKDKQIISAGSRSGKHAKNNGNSRLFPVNTESRFLFHSCYVSQLEGRWIFIAT